MMPPVAVIFFLQWLVSILHTIILFFHSLGLSWGLCIIALTVMVRLCLLPLNFRSVLAARRMQAIKPEMQAIQEKHKGAENQQQLQKELVALYQKHGVNPLGSLLPLIIQIPIFFSLYFMLRSAQFQRNIHGHAQFLFIHDLSQTLSKHPAQLAILFALYFITQAAAVISGFLTSGQTRDRRLYGLAFILPLVTGAIISRFPAGVIIYWITSNLWTLMQTLLFRGVKHGLDITPHEDILNTDETSPPLVASETSLTDGQTVIANDENMTSSADKAALPTRPGAQRKKRKHGRR